MDIGSRALYDSNAALLTFGENTDLALLPDVTITRDQVGNYVSQPGGGEPAIGASFQLASMPYLGADPNGAHMFGDAPFSIFDGGGVYVSGTLTNIRLDPTTYQFAAVPIFDGEGNSCSPFLVRWENALDAEVHFMTPMGGMDLVEGTQGFTLDYVAESDWVSLVPEPATFGLLALGGLALIRRRQA